MQIAERVSKKAKEIRNQISDARPTHSVSLSGTGEVDVARGGGGAVSMLK